MKSFLYTFLCISVGIVLPFIAVAQPVANFSANITSGCSPILVQFTDQSTGGPTSWQWDLGNGTTSNLQNPSTTYITSGTYTVILTTSNGSGSNTKTMTNYITVNPSPVISFTADSTAACPPKTIVFTNTTIPGSAGTTNYLWDFGDGTTSTQVNPSHTYTTAGNFNVTLLATNSSGCSKTLTKNGYIPMIGSPGANFTATNNTACSAPITTSFTNTTTNPSSYSWDFGDGGTSTLTNPTHQYNSPGNYTVRLIATNSNGCKDTMTKAAFVTISNVDAQFSSSGSACVGKLVYFTSNSTSGATLAWNFGDGGTSTLGNVVHSYNTPGTYPVRLIATIGGCNDTLIQNVTIYPNPVSQFSASAVSGCSTPFTTQFTSTSTGATSYLWLFGDGTTSTSANPSKTYNATGIYDVKLITTSANGCTDTLTKPAYIRVQTLSASMFGLPVIPFTGCGTPVTLQLYSSYSSSLYLPVTSYSWNFGDGQSASNCACPSSFHTYTSAGTYTVSVTYNISSGCSYTTQKTFTTGVPPVASFNTGPDTVCPNTPVTFTNTSSGATSYLWDFGDGTTSTVANPTHIYQMSGDFTVNLIASNGLCFDTFTIPHRVISKLPTAYFTANYNCTNRLQFTFTDMSTGASSYIWKFGDGQTSTQAGTVSHTYAAFGTYTVTQIVTNNSTGCIDSFYRIIRPFPIQKQFAANYTNICKGQTIEFTAQSDPAYASYTWNFGIGSNVSSSGNVAMYTYANTGTYSVKLIITDSLGCKDSLVKTNYINVTAPVVNFTATPATGCAPLNVNFTDQTTSANAISTRTWIFGDNTSANTSNTSIAHTYSSGIYSVQLKVTDVNGCKDSLIKTNHIITDNKPAAGFYSEDTITCGGQSVQFINTSTGTNPAAIWDFGDGGTSTAFTPAHVYTQSGNYTVKLLITNPATGCKDSITRTNYIHVQPVNVGFTLSDTFATCPPLTVNFTNTSTGLTSYNWTFGNGSQSSLANPTTIYTYPGVYSIKLYGQTTGGCLDSATKTVTVLGPTGTLSYSPTSGCSPVTVNFSTVSNNTQAWIWDMSNGTTQITSVPSYSYTYTQSGKFVPKLILSDGISCLVPVLGVDTIRVDHMNADFSFSPTNRCDTGTIQFTDTVLYSLTQVNSRSWNFGDGGTSTVHNPSHFYAAPGTYQVRLIIENTTGCLDTIIKTVTIHAKPAVSASPNQSICSGQTTSVQLQATGATSYAWTPAIGLSCTNCANPTANPSSTTTYIVTGTDGNGCTDTGITIVTINTPPSVSAGANQSVCAGGSVNLQATGATIYIWTPATGLSCTNCANPTVTPAVTTTYTVTGTDVNGCTDTGIVIVTVNTLPNVTAYANQTICIGQSAQLQATGATSYTWTPATGLSCTNCANPTAMPSATTTYIVTGTNVNGCQDTAHVTVTVNPVPNVTVSGNQSICIGASSSLLATGATSYSWSPATGLSCTNCANPTATPATTTTYVVTGTNINGCIDTAQITVTVNPLPTISGGPNQDICPGSSATLQATGGVTYSWTPATGLSCTNCANPTVTPATTTTYTVTGTNANGCVNTAQVTVTLKTLPTVNTDGNKSICIGGSVALLATGATTYSWTPATGLSCTNCANPTANPTTTTTYTVTGTTNGCTDTAQSIVTVNPLPVISAGNNQNICAGSSAQLQATGGISYTWTPATGLSCTNCANPLTTPLATTTYTVTGINANGCINTSTVTITVNPIPNVVGTGSQTICEGASASLQASGGTSYSWSPATGLSCTNCPNPTASPTITTTYIVTGIVNGCSDTAHVKVTVLPKPPVSAGSNTGACEGNSVTLHASGAQNYTWSPATGLSCTNCTDPVAQPNTTTTYTLTGTDAKGCTNTATVTVNIYPIPDVNAGEDKTVCEGSAVQLQATGANSYVWSPANGLSCTNCSSPNASPATNATYQVVGTDIHGCSDSDIVNVTVIEKQATSISPDVSICRGTSVQLLATGGTSYQWTPSTGLSNDQIGDPIASPNNTTTYRVIIKQGDCFGDTGHITVMVHDIPNINAGPDQYSGAGSNVHLQALGAGISTYQWSPAADLSCHDCQAPVATPRKTTTYTVKGISEHGCEATDDVTVFVSCGQDQLFIPNTFTPNNDGNNDRFYPQGKGISHVASFRVYNRWGELIFNAQNIPLNDPSYGWDGTYKNAPLNPDVFVYIVNAFCESGEPLEIKGDISLIR